MKKIKSIFTIAIITIMMVACKPAADEVVGNYSGTLSYGITDSVPSIIDTTAFCYVTKIDDNQVKITCNSAFGNIIFEDVKVKGMNGPYDLGETEFTLNGFSGAWNNNALTWTYSPFDFWHSNTYSFTGSK